MNARGKLMAVPYSEEIERGVIGSMILEAVRVIPMLLKDFQLSSDLFYIPPHTILCDAILEMYAMNKSIDIMTVSDYLRTRNMLENVGGATYLERIIDSTPTSAHAAYYADQLCKHFTRRQIGYKIMKLSDEFQDQTNDSIDDFLTRCQNDFCTLRKEKSDDKNLAEMSLELLERWQCGDGVKGINWPLADMNKSLSPMTDEFVFIAALPSVGKTAFAMQIAIEAVKQGFVVSFASLESSKAKIAQRFISHLAKVNTLALKAGICSSDKYKRAADAVSNFPIKRLRAVDMPMNLIQLSAWGRYEKAQGSNIIIIDNMKHIRASRSYQSIPEQFREMSQSLKEFRDDLKLPVIVLHHLNDEGKMSWSRDIARDADIIISLVKNDGLSTIPSSANNYHAKNIVDAEVSKNREGIAPLFFRWNFETPIQTFFEYQEASSCKQNI